MGRKVNGEGTIVQLEKDRPKGKCRKWQLRVSCGKDPRTGKYRTRTRRFCGTYTQANSALREFISEIEDDQAQSRTGTTLNDVAADFLARREAAGGITTATLESYRSTLKGACAHLGYAEVSAIGPRDIEDMYAAMRRGETLSGRPASGSSLNSAHRVLKLVFSGLVDDGTLVSNPFMKMPAPSREAKEKRALTPERMRALIGELDCEGELECAYFLAVSLGLRRGEVCGLSWGDVDFVQGIVSISHSYDRFKNFKAPKTKAGRRRLPMPPFVADALLRHREAQAARLADLRPPARQTDDTAVIAGPDGARMNPNRLSYHWEKDSKALGLEGWCLHELRHSYLSMLAAQGVHPKVMQELAGHSNSKTTMDIYTHVNMDLKRGAADLVQSVMLGADDGPRDASPAPAVGSDASGKPVLTVIKGGTAEQPAAPEREIAQAQ